MSDKQESDGGGEGGGDLPAAREGREEDGGGIKMSPMLRCNGGGDNDICDDDD